LAELAEGPEIGEPPPESHKFRFTLAPASNGSDGGGPATYFTFV